MKNLDQIIRHHVEATGRSLASLTVLGVQRDPYRLGTEAHRRNAEWLADAIATIRIRGPIHLRGLHYRLIGRVLLPDGSAYTNTDANWVWLSEKAAMAARFLGTVDFGMISDSRNNPPEIYTPEVEPMDGFIFQPGVLPVQPTQREGPVPYLSGTVHRQAWRLCILGEKSGLASLVVPLAQRYEATLALPDGEASTTMVERIIAAAAEDGRPLAVVFLADCDPSGWQMPVSFGRKAQALVDLRYPDVRVRVHPVGLTPEQVAQWGLPSTPLKATEARADRWQAAMGVQQTEIDAAVALAPAELTRVIDTACRSYWDGDLERRGEIVLQAWRQDAAVAMDAVLGNDQDERVLQMRIARLEAKQKVDEARLRLAVADGLFEELRQEIDLPEPPDLQIGAAEGDGLDRLIDTDDGFLECTARLVERKRYGE